MKRRRKNRFWAVSSPPSSSEKSQDDFHNAPDSPDSRYGTFDVERKQDYVGETEKFIAPVPPPPRKTGLPSPLQTSREMNVVYEGDENATEDPALADPFHRYRSPTRYETLSSNLSTFRQGMTSKVRPVVPRPRKNYNPGAQGSVVEDTLSSITFAGGKIRSIANEQPKHVRHLHQHHRHHSHTRQLSGSATSKSRSSKGSSSNSSATDLDEFDDLDMDEFDDVDTDDMYSEGTN
ncbi:DEKNAAC105077 [Brettanomyces naardenensis]|uniref:DEKNAAC105077 n=1 Tax=Brettanomyces naardenensis TaxID=13370 RepID=A0A448YSK2_BRENA|nr:DEKNAAC105077 [Brettanomyces naardenensis]